jgi:hypothetical protein
MLRNEVVGRKKSEEKRDASIRWAERGGMRERSRGVNESKVKREEKREEKGEGLCSFAKKQHPFFPFLSSSFVLLSFEQSEWISLSKRLPNLFQSPLASQHDTGNHTFPSLLFCSLLFSSLPSPLRSSHTQCRTVRRTR